MTEDLDEFYRKKGMLSREEACRRSRLSKTTLCRWARSGKIGATWVVKTWYVKAADLAKLLPDDLQLEVMRDLPVSR